MKKFIFVAMLSVGGMAVAQTTPDTTGSAMSQPSTSDQANPSNPDAMAQPADPTMSQPGTSAAQPMNSDSMPAAPAPGESNMSSGTMQTGNTPDASMQTGTSSGTTSATPQNYPACSRTVKDSCIQRHGPK